MELDLGVCQIRFSSKGGDEVTKKIQKIHEENEKMQTSFKKAKDTFTKTSKSIVAGLTAVGAAAVTACKGTERYREDMAKLNTAYETNKKSAEDAKNTYEDFYGILGESDRTVEAVNHLAFLCDTQEELSKWGTIGAGVMATFGDSLPIEGLTESANETAKVGKVTGVFADALNWAKISEDGFNEALKKCNNEQERSDLITNTLYKTYEQAGKQYREMNADIIANRKAQSELNDVMAEIGASVQPILTELTQSTANFLNSNIGTIKGILDGVVGAVQSFFTYVDNNGETIIGVISGIGTAFITWNVSTIIGNLVQGIGAFIGITKTATGVTATFNAVIKSNKCNGKTKDKLIYFDGNKKYCAYAIADIPTTSEINGFTQKYSVNFTLYGFYWEEYEKTVVPLFTREDLFSDTFTLPGVFTERIAGNTVYNQTDFPVYPQIHIVAVNNVELDLVIKNNTTGEKIEIPDLSLSKDDTIIIDTESVTAKLNNNSIINIVNDFSDFYIVKGENEISITNGENAVNLNVFLEFNKKKVGV